MIFSISSAIFVRSTLGNSEKFVKVIKKNIENVFTTLKELIDERQYRHEFLFSNSAFQVLMSLAEFRFVFQMIQVLVFLAAPHWKSYPGRVGLLLSLPCTCIGHH